MIHQKQDAMLRWFFKCLEQGIRTISIQFVQRVDNADAPPTLCGLEGKELDQLTHLIDRDILA